MTCLKARSFVCGLGAASAVLLVAFSALAAAGDHGPVTDPHINWWQWDSHAPPVGWFTVNFVIFVALLIRLAGKPVNSGFAARAERIREAVTRNERELAAAKAESETWSAKLSGVNQEASELVENAKKDGEREREKIVESAADYAKRMRSDTTTIIEQEVSAAQRGLQLEVSHEALHKADLLLESEITDADRTRLFELAVKQLADGVGDLEGVETQTSVGGGAA